MPKKEKRKTLLFHPVRKEIYRIISESPGSYFLEIASALNLPHGTVSWHLKKLEKAGLISNVKFGGRRVFFSKALRSPEIERAFTVLRRKTTQRIFSYIIDNPGCYQVEIANALNLHHDTVRYHISRLREANLIIPKKEGRTVRYMLGPTGKKLLEGNSEIITQAYIEYLFNRLREECLVPELIEKEENRVTIKISCPGMDDTYLSINLKGWEFIEIEDEEETSTTAEEEAQASA